MRINNMDKKSLENLSFNDMPKAVAFLIDKVLMLSDQIAEIRANMGNTTSDEWMTIDDLTNYLPDKPSNQTVYSWVGQKIIPYHKLGKRLYFLKSDIDLWLKNGRRKTAAEIAKEAMARYEEETALGKM